MGGCQNYGPFLGTLNIRCRIIIGTQKGTIILTTTHIYIYILNPHLIQKISLVNKRARKGEGFTMRFLKSARTDTKALQRFFQPRWPSSDQPLCGSDGSNLPSIVHQGSSYCSACGCESMASSRNAAAPANKILIRPCGIT